MLVLFSFLKLMQGRRFSILKFLLSLTRLLSEANIKNFGTFAHQEIIGKPYGLTFEVINCKAKPIDIVKIRRDLASAEIKEDSQKKYDDPNSSQEKNKETEKSDSETGSKEKKTSVFKHSDPEQDLVRSKTKSAKKKSPLRDRLFFVPLRPNLVNLAEFFCRKNPTKTKELRADTISQMLNFGNVFPGCRFLVVDDTNGLLAGAILERLGGIGEVVCVYDTEFPEYDIVRYFNFTLEQLQPFHSIRWDELRKDYGPELNEKLSKTETIVPKKCPRTINGRMKFDRLGMQMQHPKLLYRKNFLGPQEHQEFIEKRDAILKGGFDGLFIASSTTHPLGILEGLSPLLAPSRKVVMYSMYNEPLIEVQMKMKESPRYLNPQVTDCWLRKSILLPGRSLPDMASPGASGFLLTSTTILDREGGIPSSSFITTHTTKKARREDESKLSA